MLKKEYFISIIVLIFYIVLYCSLTKNSIEIANITTSDILLKSNKPKEIPIARIEISNINIDNYIYDFNSNNNTVEKNVTILKSSILPNKNHSIIFLAAHSGNSKISFFNNLNKIKNNQKINFYYNNYKYIYKIIKNYEVEKDGTIEINKDSSNQLILTTCSTNNKNKQLIIESILLQKEKIS